MAQSTVKLIVDAQNAIIPLQRVNQQTQALSGTTDKLKKRLDNSNQSLRNVGRSAQSSSAGVATLTKSLAPLLQLLALAGTTRFVFMQTADLETQTKALEVLTGSAEKAQDIVKEIKDFGSVTPFKSSELIDVTKRLKAFGFETEQVVDMTKRIADISGTVGADINNVALAIGKVQAKNKFMQEENVMLLEKGINVTKELERMTGLSGEEIAEAMSKGKVNAELFVQAIVNLTSKGGEFFEGASKQSDTLNGKLSTLFDNVETFAQNLGKIFKPAFETIIDELNKLVNEFNKIFKLLNDAQIGASNRAVGSASFKARFGMQADAVKDVTKAVSLLDPSLIKTEEDAAKMFAQLDRISKVMKLVRGPDSAAVLDRRGLLDPLIAASVEMDNIRDKITKVKDAFIPVKKEIEETNNVAKKFTIDLDGGSKKEKKEEDVIGNIIKKVKRKNELLAARLEGNEKEIAQKHEELDIIAQVGIFEAVEIFKLQDKTRELQKQNDTLDVQNEIVKRQKDLFTQIGDNIATSVTDGLADAIMQTKSLGDAARDILNDMSRTFLKLAINTGLKRTGLGIFSNLLGFADGGSPPVGRPSIVGERGPEIFVPRSAGTIIPNHQIGGGGSTNVVVNVDASGSSIEGEETKGRELGRLISVAVQSEIVQQKRPGGLLA